MLYHSIDTESLTDAADLIVESVRSAQFPGKLIRALDAASSKYDGEKVIVILRYI